MSRQAQLLQIWKGRNKNHLVAKLFELAIKVDIKNKGQRKYKKFFSKRIFHDICDLNPALIRCPMYIHSGRYIGMGRKQTETSVAFTQAGTFKCTEVALAMCAHGTCFCKNIFKMLQSTVFLFRHLLLPYSPWSGCDPETLTLPLSLTKDQTVLFLTLHTQLPLLEHFFQNLQVHSLTF